MNKVILFFHLVLFCFMLSGKSFAMSDDQKVVYKVDVRDEIGPKVWRLMKKSFDEIESTKVDYILLHMNTYGGLVVYADSIRSMILNESIPIWVYIDNNAASAGALIAIASDKIYMREGANIGAATVVNESGQAMPDKYQSYMRSMIRATAQSHGKDTIRQADGSYKIVWHRDPLIAEAMVDEKLTVDGIVDDTKVITFTTHEAMEYGYCDGIASSIDDVIKQEIGDNYVIKEYTPTIVDDIVGFLMNPIFQGIFIMMIVGGIYFELQSPGLGISSVVAILGVLLYFAPLYIEGIAGNMDLIVFVVGVILLLLEIFVIPGFGVTGILGIILIVGSLVFATIDIFSFKYFTDFAWSLLSSVTLVLFAILVGLCLSLWLGPKLITSSQFAFALHATQDADKGFVGVDTAMFKEIGKEGTAETDLRPGGKVLIDGVVYDAVSMHGTFLTRGTSVVVRKFQSGQLYVEVCSQN